MDTRTKLLDIVRGTRSGYWVEILHGAAGAAYMLHFPYANGATTKDMPPLPSTWDAIRVEVAHRMGRDEDADALPKYDDGRTYSRAVMGADEKAGLLRWIKT